MKLFIIRHGQSTANIDETEYFKLKDHNVPLSPLGMAQSETAGKNLQALLSKDQHREIHVFVSPYVRTRDT